MGMIKGMTGFGCDEISTKNTKGFIEIKSVNHRYLDIGYFLPVGFASIENRIREILRRRLERGRVTVSFKITQRPGPSVSFNKKTTKEYLRQSNILKKNLGIQGTLSLSEIIQLPGVVENSETILKPETLWPDLQRGIHRALNSLVAMRASEGASLSSDMSDKLKRMSLKIKKIRNRASAITKKKKKHLNPDEFLSFQKGSDINEEISRLAHHVSEFKKLLKANGAIGKKLDFIAQEMQRETNTIGSKIQDKIVSNAVIALKTKIEKLREQAQNIE